LSEGRHVSSIHVHFLEYRVVVVDFKGQRKVKHDVGSIPGHVTLDHRRLVRVDHDERKRNHFFGCPTRLRLGMLLRHRRRRLFPLLVPLDEVPEAHLLGQEVLEGLLFLGDLVLPVLDFLRHGIHVVLGRRRESLPGDFLLLLRDNVHGHQHIEGVVDPSPNVLLVKGPVGVFLVALRHHLLDQLVGNLVVGGGALFFDLLADHHGEMPQAPGRAGGPGRFDRGRHAVPAVRGGGPGRGFLGLFGASWMCCGGERRRSGGGIVVVGCRRGRQSRRRGRRGRRLGHHASIDGRRERRRDSCIGIRIGIRIRILQRRRHGGSWPLVVVVVVVAAAAPAILGSRSTAVAAGNRMVVEAWW